MSFLSDFFHKEKKENISFGVFGSDMHSHLIPGIDDGAPDIKSSITMLKQFEHMGYKKVITTPHIMSDYYKNSPETILPKLDVLRKVIKEQHIDIEIEAAAEYNMDDNFIDLVNTKQPLLTFSNNYILTELSFFNHPLRYQDTFFQLQSNGYKVILAHPERYGYWSLKNNPFKDLREQGVLLQINLLSLTGYYGPDAKKMSKYLIDHDLISFVGTDCHNINQLHLLQSKSHLTYYHKLANSSSIMNHHL